MRTPLFIGLLLLTSVGVNAQKTVQLNSKIDNVTVYPRGAEVEASASAQLSAGRQTLVFSGISSEIDAQSVSVSASNGVNVLSVSTQNNFLRQPKLPVAVQRLKDSLDGYTFDHKFNQNMIEVYAQERQMILANQKVGWEESQFVIEDLEDLSDFYRDRLADIMLKRMEIEQEQKELQMKIDRLKRQLNETSGRTNRATGEVLVEVQVAGNVKAKVNIKYMVQTAGWTPSYKIMVADVSKPLNVAYNAKVFQNTGVSWEGVTLTLTNANPNLSGQKPELFPWRLDFYEPDAKPYAMNMSNKRMALVEKAEAMSDDMELELEEGFYNESSVEYAVNKAITRFEIRTRYNVPSNGKPQVIGIDAFTIPAAYEYFASPKLDPAAFLIAKVSGFEKYDLLPGQANLFLNNTFVGEAFIDPNVIGDTLDLSLGRDPSITVKREKIKDFEASRKIGSSIKETIAIEISVRNTKSGKIRLSIEDQIPVSGNKDIEVQLTEDADGKFDAQSGKLTWLKTINPSSKEEFTFSYSVKYPEERRINF